MTEHQESGEEKKNGPNLTYLFIAIPSLRSHLIPTNKRIGTSLGSFLKYLSQDGRRVEGVRINVFRGSSDVTVEKMLWGHPPERPVTSNIQVEHVSAVGARLNWCYS